MKRIVFCDFDGTITEEETFVGMLRRFAEQDYQRVEKGILDGSLTLATGVRMMVESIPADRLPAMKAYIAGKRLRPGFAEFLGALQAWKIPLVVVSGGLGVQVRTRLAEFQRQILAVVAAEAQIGGSKLRVVSEFEDDFELVAKAAVMERFDYDEAAAIGDGITDLSMARKADVVFARNGLASRLGRMGVDSIAWETFYDVQRELAARWMTTGAPVGGKSTAG